MKKIFTESYKSLNICILACVFFLHFFFTFFSTNAQDIQNKPEKSDSLLMIEYKNKGLEAYNMDNFELAKTYLNQSLEIGRRIYGESSYQIAPILNNIGVMNKNLGEYDAAIENYLEAEKIYIEAYSADYPNLGITYTNIGVIQKIKGDYNKYKEYEENAVRIYLANPDEYKDKIIDAQYNYTESLYFLKQYDEAINNSLQNLKSLSGEIESYYTGLLARIYTETGNTERADFYYQETFRLLKRDYGEESADLGVEYLSYVSFLLSVNQFDKALEYNQLAEKLIEKYYTSESSDYGESMLDYAKYYLLRTSEASLTTDFNEKKKEDLVLALDFFQRAIASNSRSFKNSDPSTNPTTDDAISDVMMLQILSQKALCFETLGDINLTLSEKQEAIENYQSALDAISLSTEYIHQIRTGFESEDSRLFLSENQESTFFDAVNICYKLYEQTSDIDYAIKGYEFTEKGKSASFLAAVKDSRAQEFGNVPDSLINQENVLKLNITNYKEMLFEENQMDEPDPERVTLYDSKIFEYNDQYSKLISFLEENYPNYYAFKYKDEVVSIEQIREKLKTRDAIVEYLIQEPDEKNKTGRFFRFVITDNNFIFSAQPINQSFVNNIETVYNFLTDPGYLNTGLEEYKNYALSAYNLYSDLLGNVSNEITGKRLVIIPDDKLSYIPFDALLSEQPDTTTMNFRTLPYLVKDYAISYTYSTTLLYNYFEKEREAPKELLAFAPNYLDDDRDYTDMTTFRSGLTPLPAVEKEVEYISNYVSGDIFTNENAQENEFKKDAPNYDILHLAMHTILNDTLPMYSRLAFSKPAPDSEDDGWLNTSEIYTMQLKARMAVLSACNTGSGKLQKGEGVMSLARGFLYAGCPSIIMTLWEVEDESGALIMKDFYRILAKGKSKDEALRLAKLAHIENADPLKAHPHYWLGYVAVGNSEPLFTSNNWYLIIIIVGIVVIIFLDQTFRVKNKKKSNTKSEKNTLIF